MAVAGCSEMQKGGYRKKKVGINEEEEQARQASHRKEAPASEGWLAVEAGDGGLKRW